MRQTPAHPLVGLGGWEHEAFDTCLYPRPGMTSAEKLSYYSRYFTAVEVRPTFWDDTITPDDACTWAEAVGDVREFLFLVKLHAQFTHRRTIRAEQARTMRGILHALDARDRRGALLMQFPDGFTNVSGNRYHVVRLAETFNGFPVYAEFRHASWDHPSTPAFLQENGLLPVNSDLPRVRQLISFAPGLRGTSAYLRLHGRNEKGWMVNAMDARYDYLYNGRELQEIRRRLDTLASRSRRVTVIWNNTTAGKAVANALQLLQALHGAHRLPLPPASCRAFAFLDTGDAPLRETPLFGEAGYKAAI